LNLFGYLRYSPRPVVKWTLDKQRGEISRWADVNGHTIVEWFTDKAVSGDDNARKVARSALLAALRDHKAEGVVVADLSRWTREGAVPALYFIDQLEAEGIKVFSVWEDFLNVPSDFRLLILHLVLAKNELELKRLRENISRGVNLAIASGVWFGPAPLYYRRVRRLGDEPDGRRVSGENYWIECVEPLTVTTLFEGRCAGKSLARLAAEVGTSRTQVINVLALKENKHVVGERLWDAAQGVKGTQRLSKWYRSYLLTGLVVCPTCGRHLAGRMRLQLRTYGRVAYRCMNAAIPHPWQTVSQNRILRPLREYVDGLDLDEHARADVLARMTKPVASARLTERQKKVAAIARQRKLVLGIRKRGDLPDQTTGRLLSELDRDEKKLAPEVVPPDSTERPSIDALCSLGGIIRQVEVHDYPRVQAANAVLREVFDSITFADGDRDRVVLELKPVARAVYDIMRSISPIAAADIGRSADEAVVDTASQSVKAARREYERRWRGSLSGRAAARANQKRYRAKLVAKGRALRDSAVDKRYGA
jgi:DNA invertase Pin-like site-specific DNA recombinase